MKKIVSAIALLALVSFAGATVATASVNHLAQMGNLDTGTYGLRDISLFGTATINDPPANTFTIIGTASVGPGGIIPGQAPYTIPPINGTYALNPDGTGTINTAAGTVYDAFIGPSGMGVLASLRATTDKSIGGLVDKPTAFDGTTLAGTFFFARTNIGTAASITRFGTLNLNGASATGGTYVLNATGRNQSNADAPQSATSTYTVNNTGELVVADITSGVRTSGDAFVGATFGSTGTQAIWFGVKSGGSHSLATMAGTYKMTAFGLNHSAPNTYYPELVTMVFNGTGGVNLSTQVNGASSPFIGNGDGTYAVNADGSFTYTLGSNTVNCGIGASREAFVCGLVSNTTRQMAGFAVRMADQVINNVPVIDQGAGPLGVTMDEDGNPTAWAAPTLGATDADAGDTLTWSVLTQAAHGTATVSGTGASPTVFTYAPAANWNGSDSFTVQVSDGTATDTIVVNVTVNAQNDAPTATSANITTNEDTASSGVTPGVTDADAGDSYTFTIETPATNGTASIVANQLVYTPNANYNGADSFTYRATEVGSAFVVGTASVTVNAVSDAPTNTAVPLISGTPAEGETLTATDGSWTNNSNPPGTITYAYQWYRDGVAIGGATANSYLVAGVDVGKNLTFGVIATANTESSSEALSAPAAILNNAPVISQGAGPLGVTMSEDGNPTTWAAPTLDATDANTGTTLTWSVKTQALHGTATVSGTGASPGVFTYAPAANWNGSDSFTVQVSDGTDTDTIVVNVTVNPVNDLPTYTNAPLTVNEDTTGLVTPNIVDVDLDYEGDSYTLSIYGPATHGTASVSGSQFQYIPAANYHGADSFEYSVTDAGGASVNGTALVTVTAVSDAPSNTVIPAIGGTAQEGSQLTADPGIWTNNSNPVGPITYGYQWYRDADGSAGGEVAIGGATASTYTVAAADVGQYLKVAVVGTANSESSAAVYSLYTAQVPNTPPTIEQGVGPLLVTMDEDGSPTAWVAPTLSATDPNSGQTLTWSLALSAVHGTATVSGSGASPGVFTYVPITNWSGADSFRVMVSDGVYGGTDTITVNVTVNAVSDAPSNTEIPTISGTAQEGSQLTAAPGTWTNNSNPVGTITYGYQWYRDADGSAGGEVLIGGATANTYTVAAADLGYYLKVAVVGSANGDSSAAVSSAFTALVPNTPPTINQTDPLAVIMSEDGAPTAWLAPTLSATDPNSSQILTWSVLTPASHGTATVSGNGTSPTTFTYAPAANWSGADSFVVQVSDGSTGTDTITVNVTVNAVNDTPSSTSVAPIVTNEDTASSGATPGVTDVDAGDTFTFTIETQPANGEASIVANQLVYTPDANYHGADSFTYRATDSGGAFVLGTANVTVNSISDAPSNTEIPTISGTAQEGSQLTAAPGTWTNNSNPVGTITYGYQWYRDVDGSAGGEVLIGGATTSTYTVAAADLGYYLKVAVVGSANGDSSAAVSSAYTALVPNTPPSINQTDPLAVTMSEDGAPTAWVRPTLTATDPNSSQTLEWSVLTGAAHGTATVSGNGTTPVVFTYAPNANYNGLDSFVVRVYDGAVADTITVNVTVNARSDAPTNTAVPVISGTLAEGQTLNTTPGNWTNISNPVGTITYAYQWYRNGAPIGAATTSSHLVVSADVGTNLTVGVIATANSESSSEVFSAAAGIVNSAPVITQGAGPLPVTMSEDSVPTAWVAPTLGVTDVNTADILTWSVLTPATHGTATVSGTGGTPTVFTYAPNTNYNGADSFVVRVFDGTVADTITVNVTVNAVSDAPANTVLPVISGTLAEGQTLNVTSGTWTDNSNPVGTVTYAYQWYRNGAPIGAATTSSHLVVSADVGTNLTVGVIATANTESSSEAFSAASGIANSAPIIAQGAGPLGVTMSEDSVPTAWVAPTLGATDVNTADTLTWSVLTPATHGTATVSGNGTSPTTFTYVPTANYNGADSFVVRVFDGTVADTITVNVTVNAVSDAPANTAVPVISGTLAEGQTLNVTSGTWTNSSNPVGTVTYAYQWYRNNVAIGTATTSSYLVTSADVGTALKVGVIATANAESSSEVFSSAVNIANSAPLITQEAGPLAVTMSEDGSPLAWAAPTLGATDVNTADILTWSVLTPATHGTATVSGTGGSPTTFTYVPVTNYNGADSFVVQVSDGAGGTDTITVNVTVNAVNDLPTMTAFSDLDSRLDVVIGPLAFTIDDAEDGGAGLTLSATSSNASVVTTGGIALAGAGTTRTVTITPIAGAAGITTITVTATDTASVPVSQSFEVNVQWSVTATAGTGGTIAPSGLALLDLGQTPSYAVTVNAGYLLDELMLDGVSLGYITEYTFDGTPGDYELTATFLEIQDKALTFPPYDGLQKGVVRSDGGNNTNNLDDDLPRADLYYTFRAIYRDSSGTPPDRIVLVLDGHQYDMSLVAGSVADANGAEYAYTTKLGAAHSHSYRFEVRDGSDNVVVQRPNIAADGFATFYAGPEIRLLNGWNMLGFAKDAVGTTYTPTAAFGSATAKYWQSTGITVSANQGSFVVPATIDNGQGYFVNLDTPANPTVLPDHSAAAAVAGETFTIDLLPGWNMIANPYDGNVPLRDVLVQQNGDTPVSWETAAGNGWIYNAIYPYNGSDWGGTYAYESAGGLIDAALVPWYGYYVYLEVNNGNSYTLIVPMPAQ